MPQQDLEFFVKLESGVWEALLNCDPESDRRLLSEDFLGVYKDGFAGREDHAGQLSGGPTVKEYRILDARTLTLCEGVVLLAYRAEWTGLSANGNSSRRSAYITSIWKLAGSAWLNVFSQDTETLQPAAPVG